MRQTTIERNNIFTLTGVAAPVETDGESVTSQPLAGEPTARSAGRLSPMLNEEPPSEQKINHFLGTGKSGQLFKTRTMLSNITKPLFHGDY